MQYETRGTCAPRHSIGPGLVSRFPGGAVAPTASQWVFRLRYSGHRWPFGPITFSASAERGAWTPPMTARQPLRQRRFARTRRSSLRRRSSRRSATWNRLTLAHEQARLHGGTPGSDERGGNAAQPDRLTLGVRCAREQRADLPDGARGGPTAVDGGRADANRQWRAGVLTAPLVLGCATGRSEAAGRAEGQWDAAPATRGCRRPGR